MKYITTSWDDGYFLDERLADLLEKYGLQGTFYVPRSNPEYSVLPESRLQDLGRRFELGGHTMGHTSYDGGNLTDMTSEIRDCFAWVADLTGEKPVSFAPPKGYFDYRVMDVAFDTGFQYFRTVNMFSTSLPMAGRGSDTTLQVFRHSRKTYSCHLAKNGRFSDLLHMLMDSRSNSIRDIVEMKLAKVEAEGGCLHIWGHSWEIEENGLWKELEEVFKLLSDRPGFRYVSNGELAKASMS